MKKIRGTMTERCEDVERGREEEVGGVSPTALVEVEAD
jgi:hypothetical protein